MTSRAHCVLDDLLYRADQKILFTWLSSLLITNFARAIEFGEAWQFKGTKHSDILLCCLFEQTDYWIASFDANVEQTKNSASFS
jgi:hypothetical protein